MRSRLACCIMRRLNAPWMQNCKYYFRLPAGEVLDSEMLLEMIFNLEESTHSNGPMTSIRNPEGQGAVGGLDRSLASRMDTQANLETAVTLLEVMYDVEELRKRNKTLKSNITCKVCMDHNVGVLFLPCQHLICCEPCSDSVKRCPLCRQPLLELSKRFCNSSTSISTF